LAAPPAVRDALGGYYESAATLGRRTAELHLALASGSDPAFAPERMTRADWRRLAGAMKRQARRALRTLARRATDLPPEARDLARRVQLASRRILDRFDRLEGFGADGARIRIHGDYHLGQVLWAEDDFYIVDFEGEPARPLEERRHKQSPLKDIAGMLRSYGYAAHVGLLVAAGQRPDDRARLEPWARVWATWSASAFLRSYLDTAGGAMFLPSEPAAARALLDAFALEKACYELEYELNNRPDWVEIPLAGLLALSGPGGPFRGGEALR
ncbi:MAG TPA: phosphotransferase, partial [Vicinamibacterales bacterium]|nr:phosphotransferase [Vicinamibacterales bacterium]